MLISLLCALRHLRPNDSVDVCGRCCVIEEFPFVGEVRLAVLTRFRERAIRSYRTIDRVGPSKRDFTSQSEINVW